MGEPQPDDNKYQHITVSDEWLRDIAKFFVESDGEQLKKDFDVDTDEELEELLCQINIKNRSQIDDMLGDVVLYKTRENQS